MARFRYLQWAAGAVVVAGLAVVAACGGGGGGGSGSGTLRLALTDAPSCGYDAVYVTVEKVRVHQSNGATDADGGWSEIVLNPARRVDLLSLTNGVLMELGQMPLPAGKYTQMRLVLADTSNGQSMANAVVPTGGAEVTLKTPSGQQTGIKTNINIAIAENRMADFVLDFDACKSVVRAGNSGQYLLKPVVTVVPRYVSGVQGQIADAPAGTQVSLQVNGSVVRATAPDATGRYLLQLVEPGTYTLVMTAPGRTTTVFTGVTVAADTVTPISGPVTLAVSPTATVGGTAPADTLVRALQPLTAGVAVEVAGGYVNSVTGVYVYALPVNAPQVAAFGPGPLVFTPDTAAAGRYVLRASLTGFAEKEAAVPTLAAGASATQNFAFP